MGNKSSLSLLVSLIKINLIKNQLNAKVPYSKLNLKILIILYQAGFIRGFRIFDLKHIFVYLIPSQRSILQDISYFSLKNKNNFISYRKLVSQYGLKNFLIISTDIGLLTLEHCFLYKKGGQLLILIPR